MTLVNYEVLSSLCTHVFSLKIYFPDICVQNVNELSRYQLIWTDEDGFLLKPLGMEILECSIE